MSLPSAFDHDRCCELVGEAVTTMADATRGLAPTTEVPSCPEWTVAKLLRHTGTIHRWVTAMVVQGSTERLDRRSLDLELPDDDRWLPGWLAGGGDALVAALQAADPDQAMWAWGDDQHVRWWPRRMLHETTVHRIDAELARGERTPVLPEVAVDGIDEMLSYLRKAAEFSPSMAELRGDGTVLVRTDDPALDEPAAWQLQLLPDDFAVDRAPADATADVTVSGGAEALLVVLARRGTVDDTDVTVTGDRAVLDHWLAHSALE